MVQAAPLVSVNGVLGAAVSPLDRGLAYGDGLFETVAVRLGKRPLWAMHLQRLTQTAERLNIPLPPKLESYSDQLLQAAASQGLRDGTLKVILTRGSGGRGYAPPTNSEPMLCLAFYPLQDAAGAPAKEGVKVYVCEQRLGHNPGLAGLKHLNRLEQVLARAEWQDEEFSEGLLLDIENNVVEATASNIFMVREAVLVTPDLALSGVSGILRRLIIERLAPELGYQVVIEQVSLEQLQQADEIFLCNSVRGIWPVISLGQNFPRSLTVGAVTRALQSQLENLLERGLA